MYTRIDADTLTCAEFIDFDPAGCFHPDLVWAEVPENIRSWIDHSWGYTEGAFAPPDLGYLRAAMRIKLAGRRRQVQNGGMRVDLAGTNTSLRTDAQARADLLAAATRTARSRLLWKFTDNDFRALTRSQLSGLQTALREFLTACFAREQAISDALETLDDLPALLAHFVAEINSSWPEAALYGSQDAAPEATPDASPEAPQNATENTIQNEEDNS